MRANVIFTVANVAHAVTLKVIGEGRSLSREVYVRAISTNALQNFNLDKTAPLLNKLQCPVEALPQQVVKAFLLAHRNLYALLMHGRPLLGPSLSTRPRKALPSLP